MSRLDDLIDLTRSVHDTYLVNPARNVRLAYIQVDDLAELAFKTWLQGNVAGWSAVSHQHNGRDRFKGFYTLINEVQQENGGNVILPDLLQRFKDRRENRNRFFHDHNMAALTVTEEECLRAFCDLYLLFRELFPDFAAKLKANRIANTQSVFIRLRHAAITEERLAAYCRKGLENIIVTVHPGTPTHEWRSIYNAPEEVLNLIRACFEDELSACSTEIQRIDDLKRITAAHQMKRARLIDQRDWLMIAIREYFS